MRNAVKEINDKHRMCRLWGHPWEPTTVDRDGSVYIQGLRCPRCDRERFVHIPPIGRGPRTNRYKGPKEYTVEGGLSARDRHDLWRLEAKTHL